MKDKYSYARHEAIDICFFAPLDYKIQRLQSRLPKQNGDWGVKHLENGDFEVIKR